MGLSDAEGVPLAVHACSVSPHEVTLVEATFDDCVLNELPEKVIGDKAYDSDKLDETLLEERGVELITPHKKTARNRRRRMAESCVVIVNVGGLNVCLRGFKISGGWWCVTSTT